MALSDKIKTILNAAVKTSDITAIAAELNLSVQAVTGSLATIKKENLATYENKKLVLTTEGLAAIGVQLKKKKNKEKVADLVKENPGLSTKEHVDRIASLLNITAVAARVYRYNYEISVGLRTPGSK